jgi:glycosyltransferase involved in cell wall biosynthesis
MRLAVVGAFPFPHVQGSQVFVRDQLRALRDLGARPVLFCYGAGLDLAAPADGELVRVPRALSPRGLRAGPSAKKPVADAVLAARLVAAHRRRPFAAVLAHNAEAALAALAARAFTGVPVVYVAHTLLRHELSSYGPRAWRAGLDALGGRIDAFVARRVDAVAALGEEAREALAPRCRGPAAVIPPGLAARPLPGAPARVLECERHGLEPGRFVLYAGNLDAYQELPLLAEAARDLAPVPVVVASHDPRADRALPARLAGLRAIRVRDLEEVRALCAAAGALVAPRRRPGGFPVKLLNYMEAARPIVAFSVAAPGLRHGREAVLLPETAGSAELCRALAELLADPERAASLGRAAREHLAARHHPRALARATLELVADARRARRERAFPAHFSCAVEVRAPVERVFAELARPDSFLGLQPLLAEVRELPARGSGSRRFEATEHVRLPRWLGRARLRNRIETVLRPVADEARIAFLTRSRPGILLRGDFRLSLAEHGTRVEERVALRAPLVVRRFVVREARAAQRTLLDRLKRRLEQGPPASGGDERLAATVREEGAPHAHGGHQGVGGDHDVEPGRARRADAPEHLARGHEVVGRHAARRHPPEPDLPRHAGVRQPEDDAPAQQRGVVQRLERGPEEAHAAGHEARPEEGARRPVAVGQRHQQVVQEARAQHHGQRAHERQRRQPGRPEDAPGHQRDCAGAQGEGEATRGEEGDDQGHRLQRGQGRQGDQGVAEAAQDEGEADQQLRGLARAPREQQQAGADRQRGDGEGAEPDPGGEDRRAQAVRAPRAAARTSCFGFGKKAAQMQIEATSVHSDAARRWPSPLGSPVATTLQATVG